MDHPATRYARSGEYHIAYQVLGTASPDLVYVPGWVSHLDLYREEPSVVRFFDRLAASFRLIVFDKRGIGLSDPVPPDAMPTLEERMDDVRAVLDAAGSARAVVVGQGYGCPIAAIFAATHPERVEALVLYSPVAKTGMRTEDYPWGSTPADREGWRQRLDDWGTDAFAEGWVARMAPSAADDRRFVDWAARVMRASASPATARSFTEMNATMDVRAILPSIRVPTLVLVREHVSAPKGGVDVSGLEEATWIAERIPNATLAVLPGRDYLPWIGDQESIVREIVRFATGAAPTFEPERVLLTVLFTDIVGSTELAARVGDERWRALLERHNEIVRDALSRHRGTEIDRAGDGVLSTFDGPARAIRCAQKIVSELAMEGITIRAGIHAGEVERIDGGIGGIAVHIGARVVGAAEPGEVLVTSTVRDLVAGSGLSFNERGVHELKGVEEGWALFSVHAATPDEAV